jgi:hypothetical protein
LVLFLGFLFFFGELLSLYSSIILDLELLTFLSRLADLINLAV